MEKNDNDKFSFDKNKMGRCNTAIKNLEGTVLTIPPS